jgi:hypothetical protein
MSGYDVLESVVTIQQVSLPALLQSLLEERGRSKAELYDFLIDRQYLIEKTSLYRYFNPNKQVTRIPDADFILHFAEFVGLPFELRVALQVLWQVKRDRRHDI